jgi:hypothetical protein
VVSSVPALSATLADQTQIRLVNEGRRLERLPRRFVGQIARGQPAQFLIDERQELSRSLRVAGLEGIQHYGDV